MNCNSEKKEPFKMPDITNGLHIEGTYPLTPATLTK